MASANAQLDGETKQTMRDLVRMMQDVKRENEELRSRISKLEDKKAEAAELRYSIAMIAKAFGADDVIFTEPGFEQRSHFERIREQFDELIENVETQAERFQMIQVEDGKGMKPDQRAAVLRITLYNKAKNSNGKASLNKDTANAALGGSLTRATLMDAMRRAADGAQANIDGSSNLEPIDAIKFQKFDDPDKLSRIVIDLDDLTDREARKILTTGSTQEGV